MVKRQRTRSKLDAAAGINDEARALLAALGIERRVTPDEARRQGYRSVNDLAAMAGIGGECMQRKLNQNAKLFESVCINQPGGGKFYRLKRK